MGTNKAARARALRQQAKRQARSQAAAGHAAPTRSAASRLQGSGLSPWHQAPADKRALLEQFDNFAPLRNGLLRASAKLGHWAGIPMPLEGEQLVVEPKYPHAEALMGMCGQQDDERDADPDLVGAKVRNTFFSTARRAHIIVAELANGRIEWGVQPALHHLTHDLQTLGCSEAWGIQQESNALALLATMLPHRKYKQYLLTGMFLESSQRSGVTYLFRRLKPTVAIKADHARGTTKVLCALCLHPIAYYAGTWAGAMCPTDDVIAHLSLMRGDEAMFWRRANQHPAFHTEAGL